MDDLTLIRIERKIDALAKPKPFWVSASEIMEVTGWSTYQLEVKRKANEKFWKVSPGGGYFYDINLIPDSLKKQPA